MPVFKLGFNMIPLLWAHIYLFFIKIFGRIITLTLFMQFSYEYSFSTHDVFKFCIILPTLPFFLHIWNFWHVRVNFIFITFFLLSMSDYIMHPNWQVKMHDHFILPQSWLLIYCMVVFIIKQVILKWQNETIFH